MLLDKTIKIYQQAMTLYLDNYPMIDFPEAFIKTNVKSSRTKIVAAARIAEIALKNFTNYVVNHPNDYQAIKITGVCAKYCVEMWFKTGYYNKAISVGIANKKYVQGEELKNLEILIESCEMLQDQQIKWHIKGN